MIKICYFTSKVSSDIRVFEKECTTLAKAGYLVYLVSPNAKDEIKNGVQIIGVPYRKKGIFSRLLRLPRLLYKRALLLDADIYHFNDPASLPFGLKLKRKGKKVIFDSFEDHPTLFLEHKEIPLILRQLISKVYALYEYYMCAKLDGILCCYHWTRDRLYKACKNTELVFNFPMIKEEQLNRKNEIIQNRNSICYAGLFSPMWNLHNVIIATTKVENIKLNLAGHGSDSILRKLKETEGWNNVNYLGHTKFEEVYDLVYSKSFIGMALLDYIPLCKGTIGNLSNNKLFEYMLAGLPVICTDFTLWKEVVEKNNCGICVNPRKVEEIVDAINYLVKNPEVAKQMGQNGRKAVIDRYNWQYEEKKLMDVYQKL